MSALELPDDDDLTGLERLTDDAVRQATIGWLIGQRSPNTRRAYRHALNQWTAWCAKRRIDPVNPRRQQVQAWITWMQDIEGKAPATVRARHGAIKAWHAELGAEGVREPVDVHYKLKVPPAQHDSNTRLLTDDEVRALLAAARTLDTPAETGLAMMAAMGLRASEAAVAEARHVTRAPSGPLLTVYGKGNKVTAAPVPRVVLQAARRVGWPGTLLTKRAVVSHKYPYDRLVRHITPAVELAGIEDFHCHMLRHWFVSRALQLGVAERHVQASARHASFDTTARYNRANDVLEHHATHVVAPLLEVREPGA